MGSVGNFLFGGSKQSENQQSSSNSSNQSQNSSTNASMSNQAQASANASGTANRAYDPLSAALTPSLGYVTSAGNMLGALLGLPQSTFSYQAPPPSVMPSSSLPALPHSAVNTAVGNLIQRIANGTATNSAAPPPSTTPPAQTAPGTRVALSDLVGGGGGGSGYTRMQMRATGGPVNAGQPYVVGEKQPEVFVPNQSGTIVPSVGGFQALMGNKGPRVRPPRPGPGPVPTPTPTPAPALAPYTPPAPVYNPNPGSPTDAVNNFANSAGMNFILDQGQKAISGASAANGTFNSGATGKALVQYGQNLGSTYLNDYMNHLLDYAKLGLGSASALTGAGGVSQSAGSSLGSSGSTSVGTSQGTSSGLSSSLGTGSSSGSSKKGLVPDLLG